VALQAAIRSPERVNNLVLISAPFKRTGWLKGCWLEW
jgi:pimeloyl-ACP methyl ester carboxylesterase